MIRTFVSACRLAEVSPLLFIKSCCDNTRREPTGTNILESVVATFLCAREQRDAQNFSVTWPVLSSSVLLCFRSTENTQSPLCTNQYTSHNSTRMFGWSRAKERHEPKQGAKNNPTLKGHIRSPVQEIVRIVRKQSRLQVQRLETEWTEIVTCPSHLSRLIKTQEDVKVCFFCS